MVHTCCMCGKCYNPSLSRTFHRIPKNEEKRKKWLNVIGRTVYKTATVCSDHFTGSDYSDNFMSQKRHLKNTAIPSSMQHESENKEEELEIGQNKEEELEIGQNKEEELEIGQNKEEELEIGQNKEEELEIGQNKEEEFEIEQRNENNDNNNNSTGHKRKLPSKRDMSTRKRVFVKTSVSNTVWFTEADFCEKEKWTTFLQYVSYNRRKHKNSKKNHRRSQIRQLTMQTMLQDLC